MSATALRLVFNGCDCRGRIASPVATADQLVESGFDTYDGIRWEREGDILAGDGETAGEVGDVDIVGVLGVIGHAIGIQDGLGILGHGAR